MYSSHWEVNRDFYMFLSWKLLWLLLQAFFFFLEGIRKSITSFFCDTRKNFSEPCNREKYIEGAVCKRYCLLGFLGNMKHDLQISI